MRPAKSALHGRLTLSVWLCTAGALIESDRKLGLGPSGRGQSGLSDQGQLGLERGEEGESRAEPKGTVGLSLKGAALTHFHAFIHKNKTKSKSWV